MTFMVILAIAGLAIPLSERLIAPHLRALRHLDIVRLDAAVPPRLAQFRVHLRMLSELSADLLTLRLANLPAWLLRAFFWTSEALLVCLTAELCMVLPMAIYFHRATLFAFPLNFLDIPLLSVLLCIAIITFLASLISAWLALIPAAITALLLHLMRFTVDRMPAPHPRRPPHTRARAHRPRRSPASAIAYCCWALRAHQPLALRHRRPRRPRSSRSPSSIPTPPRSIPAPSKSPPSTSARATPSSSSPPTGHTMLVDAGGPTGRGRTRRHRHLGRRRRGRRALPLVAPHPPPRRRRSSPTPTPTTWAACPPSSATSTRASSGSASTPATPRSSALSLREAAASAHHRPPPPRRRQPSPGPASMPPSSPPKPAYANAGTPINNDSLVLRLDYGRPACSSKATPKPPAKPPCSPTIASQPVTLLKVGHHGSRTSTTPDFLAAVAPTTPSSPSASHNTFGHPRPDGHRPPRRRPHPHLPHRPPRRHHLPPHPRRRNLRSIRRV